MSSMEKQGSEGDENDVEFVDVDEEDDEMEGNGEEEAMKAFIPGVDSLQDGEELVHDQSAYVLYHQAQTGSPCLSFDIIRDHLGDGRTNFPLTAYLVAGTQAERANLNHIVVMKMSNLNKVKKEEDDDSSDSVSDSDEDDEDLPELDTSMINHLGGINRIRATQIADKNLVATWSETGKVHIYDINSALQALENPHTGAKFSREESSQRPLFTFPGHQTEGFAMDWSATTQGTLATGDCNKNIHVWKLQDGGSWHVDQRPYSAHNDSVEDIQWSPNEKSVFASCSVDKTIRIWDIRAMPSKACMLTVDNAHESDVNVISWNRNEPFIVSGGDDGIINIWDLRQLQKKAPPLAKFKQHTAPITSVEWHPADSTIFAASGADDQVTLWDLALECDVDQDAEGSQAVDVPPQLLFIHQGQTEIKEVHWHPQLPGVILSTAQSGFNIFRTISV